MDMKMWGTKQCGQGQESSSWARISSTDAGQVKFVLPKGRSPAPMSKKELSFYPLLLALLIQRSHILLRRC